MICLNTVVYTSWPLKYRGEKLGSTEPFLSMLCTTVHQQAAGRIKLPFIKVGTRVKVSARFLRSTTTAVPRL